MSATFAITVNQVSKSYRIWDSPSARLKAAIMSPIASRLPASAAATGQRKAGDRYRDFFALENISLEIEKGESVGIIGLNGSGKSTLLQIIAGTVQPTTGSVSVNGRIAALLELGSGFNPEFTGSENVYLNAAVLGLSRREVDQQFDDIAAFADIGNFIDQPVKTYSSGMFVRLAFAVSTHVAADVLLIDEALTVGDIFFQQKCYVRLNKLKDRGVAIVLVTHGMNDVEQFCSRAFLLHGGRLHASGRSVEVVKHYYLLNRSEPILTASAQTETKPAAASAGQDPCAFWPAVEAEFDLRVLKQVSDGWAKLTRIAVCDIQGAACRRFEQGGRAVFYYEFELLKDLEVPVVGLVFFNNKSVIVHGKNSLEYGSVIPSGFRAGETLKFRHEVALELATGEYTFEVGLASVTSETRDGAGKLTHFELMERTFRHCHVPEIGPLEVAFRQNGTPVQLLHHGVANLPGSLEFISTSTAR